jgi:hypothetical protein
MRIPHSWRTTLVAVVSAACMWVATVAPMTAQAGPEVPVQAVLEAVESGRIDDAAAYICEEYRDATLASFVATKATAAPGASSPPTLDDVYQDAVEYAVTILSQDASSAVVSVTTDVSVTVDETAARGYAAAMLEELGQEPSEEAIELALGLLLSEAPTPMQLVEDVDVVLRDGAWLVCQDPTASGMDAATEDDPAASPGGDG